MNLIVHGDEPDAEAVVAAISRLFDAELTGALAAAADGTVATWTAFLAPDWPMIFFTSQETTSHAVAIADGAPAALAIWRRPDAWGDPLCGLQITGYCEPITDADEAERGLHALHERFPGTRNTVPALENVVGSHRTTVLFQFRAASGTVIDEDSLGEKNFVSFEIAG
jgi:hypothetical protein